MQIVKYGVNRITLQGSPRGERGLKYCSRSYFITVNQSSIARKLGTSAIINTKAALQSSQKQESRPYIIRDKNQISLYLDYVIAAFTVLLSMNTSSLGGSDQGVGPTSALRSKPRLGYIVVNLSNLLCTVQSALAIRTSRYPFNLGEIV